MPACPILYLKIRAPCQSAGGGKAGTPVGKKILTINLGTTSTRLAVFEEDRLLAERDLIHPEEDIKNMTQKEHVAQRKELMEKWLKEIGVSISSLAGIAMRIANLPKSILGGTIEIKDQLRRDLAAHYQPEKPLTHGTDITLALADAVCGEEKVPYYVVDPANQNNMIPEARISGHPIFQRSTIFHALNQKSVAHLQAEKLGRKYEACNFVVAHMGGGISVCAHEQGRIIDTTNCSGEDGPFSGTRTGTLPARQLIDLCFSGKYRYEEVLGMLLWKGGVSAYLGTGDMREVEKRANSGDEQAALIFRTVAYRTAKEIGAMCAAMNGKVDGIILTGGMSNSQAMCRMIEEKVSRFAPVSVYAGERESEALAAGVLRILNHEEEAAVYPD